MKKCRNKAHNSSLYLTWIVNPHIFFLGLIIFLFQATSTNAQWTRKADGLKPRSELGETIVYNSKLYSFRGFSDTLYHAEPSSEVYNPATNAWTEKRKINDVDEDNDDYDDEFYDLRRIVL